jgi:hypothetical protein
MGAIAWSWASIQAFSIDPQIPSPTGLRAVESAFPHERKPLLVRANKSPAECKPLWGLEALPAAIFAVCTVEFTEKLQQEFS